MLAIIRFETMYHTYKKAGLKIKTKDRLCGLVVKVSSYRSMGPGSIPGSTRFSEK
jgi:hypothetical protein